MNGFNEIRYKGKLVERDGFAAQNFRAVPYHHMYRIKRLQLFPGDPESEKVHACLINGDWCFDNLRERPQDTLVYVRVRIKRWLQKW